MKWLDERVIAFDFETTGTLPEYALQPWRKRQGKFWATSLSVARYRDGQLVMSGGLNPSVDDMRTLLEEAIETSAYVVGWNTAFDISVLLAYGLQDLVFQVKWLDGLLLWRHLDIEPEYEFKGPNRRSYGLKEAVRTFIPEQGGYEEGVQFHGDLSPAEAKRLQEYNDRDTSFTWAISKHLWNALAPSQLRAALIEAQCLPFVAQANFVGMPVDELTAKELDQYLIDRAEDSLTLLAPLGVDEKVIRSPKRLAEVLFDEWKLKPIKTTGSGNRSTDQETLHELGLKDPRVAEVRNYRDALGNRTKFAQRPLEAAAYNEDGCAHSLAIIFGTYSGRYTYASSQGRNKDKRQIGFALHQMKRDPIYRATIVPPPGYTLVEFDAAGQEFRWMAIASEDPTMLKLCLPGEDPHSYMGAQIGNRDYRELVKQVHAGDKNAKALRQLGKVANLSLQYRTTANKLCVVARVKHLIDMSRDTAYAIHQTYRRAYPGVPQYWGRQISVVRSKGYVETFAGRRVKVVGGWEGPMGWSMGSTAINYRIQGTGADQKYLALACLKPYLVSIGAMFAWDLHDGIYFYIPDDKVKAAIPEMRNILETLPYEKAWGLKPPIPLPWDCKLGKSWGDLKDWKG